MTHSRSAPRARLARPLPIVVSMLLAACGGGGGAGGSPAGVSAPAPTPVNAGNAERVAAAAYDFASSIYDVASAAAEQTKSTDAAGAPSLNLAGTALAQFRRVFGRSGTGPVGKSVFAAKAVLTETIPCTSGSIVATLDDANGNGDIDAGESASIAFQNCVTAGVRFSGTMGMRVNAYAETATTENANLTFTFTGFGATTLADGQSASVSGDLTMAVLVTYASASAMTPTLVDATLSGNQLVGIEQGATTTISGYSGRLALSPLANTYTYRIAGTASGGSLPGAVALSTPSAISGVVGANPTAGALLVAGAGGSSVLVTVTPPTGVALAVDGDGDGTVETSRSLTWAQFLAL